MSANAVLDIGALRRERRRMGMANILSRQAYGLFAESYAQADFPPRQLPAGGWRTWWSRRIARCSGIARRRNIERLIKAGVL